VREGGEERAKKMAVWEAKQGEWKAKENEREGQRAAHGRSLKAFDEESNATDVSTLASITSLAVDEAEVERLALLDKDVRRFAKILRETEKLEGRSDLDELQKAKLRRRHDIEVQLDSAKGLADSDVAQVAWCWDLSFVHPSIVAARVFLMVPCPLDHAVVPCARGEELEQRLHLAQVRNHCLHMLHIHRIILEDHLQARTGCGHDYGVHARLVYYLAELLHDAAVVAEILQHRMIP